MRTATGSIVDVRCEVVPPLQASKLEHEAVASVVVDPQTDPSGQDINAGEPKPNNSTMDSQLGILDLF